MFLEYVYVEFWNLFFVMLIIWNYKCVFVCVFLYVCVVCLNIVCILLERNNIYKHTKQKWTMELLKHEEHTYLLDVRNIDILKLWIVEHYIFEMLTFWKVYYT